MGADGMEQRSERDQWLLESLARQAAVMEHLVTAALDTTAGDDEEEAARRWWAVERQAGRFLRMLHAGSGRGRGRCEPEHAAHNSDLEEFRRQAREALAGFDPEVVAAAAASAGLRVAVIGKGGAGKSTISATLARLLARRGRAVLAADLDTNPGMAYSLGVPPAAGELAPEAVEPHHGAPYGWRLRSDLAPADAVERYAVCGPDDVRFLSVGKIEGVEKLGPKRTVAAMRELLSGLGDPLWDVVGDLEAGPTTPFEGYHRFADRVLVVVGPAWVSALTARRLLPLVGDIPVTVVTNRFRDEPDHAGLAGEVRVPFDPEVAEAHRQGLAPIDACPESPTVAAVARLADRLSGQAVAA
jgi:CO dehydrogenase maturation factor